MLKKKRIFVADYENITLLYSCVCGSMLRDAVLVVLQGRGTQRRVRH